MYYRMQITDRAIVIVERTEQGEMVTIRSGEWPLYAVICLTQTQARELASAIMAAGYDYSRQPKGKP